MRLARVGPAGSERPIVALPDGQLFDASTVTDDYDRSFFEQDGIARLQAAAASGDLPTTAAVGRFGAPVARPGKIVCIGLNYRDHAEETGAELPSEPIVFLKDPGTVVGPDDEVLIPRGSRKTDYEVELACVIGRRARYLSSPEEALEHLAGVTISNDVSEREFQLERGGQWDKGKSCETFNPLGPWLVTGDEVGPLTQLGLRLWVDGQLRQDGKTSEMLFSAAELLHYVSQFMVLEAGDVLNTGTPAGVALGRGDDFYLRPGSVVELEIDGLGRQRQIFGQA